MKLCPTALQLNNETSTRAHPAKHSWSSGEALAERFPHPMIASLAKLNSEAQTADASLRSA